MEESILYDKIAYSTICKWRDEVENSDDCLFVKAAEKERQELREKLTEELMQEVENYRYDCESALDYVHDNINVKLLNLGIKIGMQLQKAFTEMEEG